MQACLNIGVDVSKAELVIGVVGHPQFDGVIGNTTRDIVRWLGTLPEDARIGVESTGGYHSLVVQLAQQHGFSAYVLNAHDVHFYAKALGQRGKTDRTDAQVISRYLKEHHAHLREYQPGSPAAQAIDELLRRRASLVKQRDGVRLSLVEVKVLSQSLKALLKQFDQVLAVIDKQIETLLNSDEHLAADAKRLRTIPGVGSQGAAMLSCLFRRTGGFQTTDAAIAFSGLDPRPMDSGQKRGRRQLSKRGPALLRRQLYMMAFSASRSKAFQPYYQALRARGLSATASFVILARKLLSIALAVWRSQTTFDPGRLPTPQ